MPRGSNFQKPYSPEFRHDAVELYRRSGKPLRIQVGRKRVERLMREQQLSLAREP